MKLRSGLRALALLAIAASVSGIVLAQEPTAPKSFGQKVGETSRDVKDGVKSGVRTTKKWVKKTSKEVGKATKDAYHKVRKTTVKTVQEGKKATKEFIGDVKKGYEKQ